MNHLDEAKHKLLSAKKNMGAAPKTPVAKQKIQKAAPVNNSRQALAVSLAKAKTFG